MMNYKDTLNLPRTSFPMKANLPQREEDILRSWEENNIYMQLRKRLAGNPRFILHDGPPYANGDVHLGTALNKVLKDIIVRYKSMRGFDAPFVPGWDCHGMPIEHEVVKQIRAEGRELTRSEMRRECKQYAAKFVKIQRTQFKRLGVSGDWDNPYLTMNFSYEAKIVEVLGNLFKKGFVYQGYKPVHWCGTCQTALAEAEVEYADHTSPSIYVQFVVHSGLEKEFSSLAKKRVSFLIWTTTPWTIPANVAIALHPDFDYALVSGYREGDSFLTIMASDTVERVMSDTGCSRYEIKEVVRGRELAGIKCYHPLMERHSVVVLANYVVRGEGTGCVHIAPGHGQEDYETGLEYNLPVISPVDQEGRFTAEVKEWEGLNVFSANTAIVSRLQERSVLLHTANVVHSYPHCWRCKNPVIFRATRQWFLSVNTDNLRQKALAEVEKVCWLPAWGKQKIWNLVANRPDWCLSRQRAWGVPIPAYQCDNCGHTFLDDGVIKKFQQEVEKRGTDVWFEEKEKFIMDNVVCDKCGGKNFTKETDILDVWFDSGVSFKAVLEARDDLAVPADLYLEATDQHRGWFQVSLLPSVALEGHPPYRSVLTHGLVLDGEGKKMSKSLGNVIAPQELIDKYGADILRLWFASVDYTADIRLSPQVLEPLAESYRKIRNTFRYLLGNISDFEYLRSAVPQKELLEIDRLILHRASKLLVAVTEAFDQFALYRVYHLIYNFCVVDLSAFYLDIIKDRLYTSKAAGKERHAAQTVLAEVSALLVMMIAPIMPFTAEEIWQHLPAGIRKKVSTGDSRSSAQAKREKSESISIHLTRWREKTEEWIDDALAERWERLIAVRNEVLRALEQARHGKLIGNALEARVIIYTTSSEWYDFLVNCQGYLPSLYIVSKVELSKAVEVLPEDAVKGVELPVLGVKVEKASGAKCQRCWIYSETVGREEKHPSLCARCVGIVNHKK